MKNSFTYVTMLAAGLASTAAVADPSGHTQMITISGAAAVKW